MLALVLPTPSIRETTMRTYVLVGVAAILMCASALAQANATAPEPQHAAFSAKPLMVSGKVSADGKKLLTDIDSEWMVSNDDALKGHEGRMVRVKCYVDTEKNSIKILSVKRENDDSNFAARNTFSAVGR
jgi:hypothetical protein